MDQMCLDRGSRHEQAGRDLGVTEMLAHKADDIQLAWRQARPARARAPALAATAGGIGDRLLRGEPRALGPGGREFIRTEFLLGAGNRCFVGALLGWEANIADLRPLQVRRRPEPSSFLFTVLLGGKPGEKLQPVD